MSEAQLADQVGDGTFSFDSVLANDVMDYDGSGNYNITYTPNNSSYNQIDDIVKLEVISGVSTVTIDFVTPKNATSSIVTPLVIKNFYQHFLITVEGGLVKDNSVTCRIETTHHSGTILTTVDGKERLTVSP